MSGKPAARMGDKIMCPMPQTTPAAAPHAPAGLPIIPPCAPTVLIGGAPAARIGDKSICISPAPAPNAILQGAFPVSISGMPAARITDMATHPGSMIIPPGCVTVLIGLAGIVGNLIVGSQMFLDAAKGRTSGSKQQSYQNCGVESSRQIINQINGTNVTEDALLNSAMKKNQASTVKKKDASVDLKKSGGTGAAGRKAILKSQGVDSTVQPANKQNIGVALSKGNGVIVNADAGKLWNDPAYDGGGHAVTVVGAEYDDNGECQHVYINDTGTGKGTQKMPAKDFYKAVDSHPSGKPKINVTNSPIF